jgi:RNA recognition motif. (a.k.a. RRM, RBD, or RNP domain)
VLWQDYYTGEMRGIGFVEFADERTAEDAQRGLDRMFLEGREVRSAGPWHNACLTCSLCHTCWTMVCTGPQAHLNAT